MRVPGTSSGSSRHSLLTQNMAPRSVAIIGSFKRHNDAVQRVCAVLREAGVTVTSPRGADIVKPGIDFVRFSTDATDLTDTAIQSLALHRIFVANLVYVVAPDGYVGKTTCYEIGRVLQRKQPIYFSASPIDLPLHVPTSFVLQAAELLHKLSDPVWKPHWLFEFDGTQASELERDLLKEVFRDE